jgi:hypothetical protein
MKTIKFKSLFIAIAMIITTASCTKDFLEVEPKGTDLEANYYKNKEQAFAGLVAVYDIMNKNSGGLIIW